jgi:hypothetical protein
MPRKPVPQRTEKQVLLLSRRRCCICFGLNKDMGVKEQGQIAHLDRNPNNNDVDNLAYMCLVHHDQYDRKTSQSKAFKGKEVREFRRELYEAVARMPAANESESPHLEVSFEEMPPCQITESGGKITVYRLRVHSAKTADNLNAQLWRVHPLPRDPVFRKLFPYSLYLPNGNTSCTLNPKQDAFFEFASSWIADGRLIVGVIDSRTYREKWPVPMEPSEMWYLTVRVSAANNPGKEVVLSLQPQGTSLHVGLASVKQI